MQRKTAKIIGELVERAGSRALLATAADFSVESVGKALNGKRPPGLPVVSKIAKTYKDRADELLRAWLEERAAVDLASAQKVLPGLSGGALSMVAAHIAALTPERQKSLLAFLGSLASCDSWDEAMGVAKGKVMEFSESASRPITRTGGP